MTTDNSMRITNLEGRHFNVRIVRIGDSYGLDDCLTHGEKMGKDSSPMVEFYDLSYTTKFGPRGQFVSRYYVSSILGKCEFLGKGLDAEMGIGLDLDGGVAGWSIDADAMDVVRSWLHNQTEGEV